MQAGLDEMRRTIREKEPVRPSTRLGALPGDALSTAAERRGSGRAQTRQPVAWRSGLDRDEVLEKDRARRYETVNGLAADIQRHLNNEPVVARPPSNVYRFQKLIRRNKVAVTACTGVAAALLIGFAVSSWMFFREREARREQLRLSQQAARTAERETLQRQRAEDTALRLELQRCEEFFSNDNSVAAVAHLARLLRQCPTNEVVATRLVAALTYRNFALPKAILPHSNRIADFNFTPDGGGLVTASENVVRIWDINSGQLVSGPLDHPQRVGSVDFTPDGALLATSCDDSAVRLWDIRTGRLALGPIAYPGRPMETRFSQDGRRFAVMGAFYECPCPQYSERRSPGAASQPGGRAFI
jgi:hypothetical protein